MQENQIQKLEININEQIVDEIKEDIYHFHPYTSEWEKKFLTINDLDFPTTDSKYHQGKGQRLVHYQQLENLKYDYELQLCELEKKEIEIEEIHQQIKISDLKDDLKLKKLNITMKEKNIEKEKIKLKITGMLIDAKQRTKEILHWTKLLNDLKPLLKYDKNDTENYQSEYQYKRWVNEVEKKNDNVVKNMLNAKKGFESIGDTAKLMENSKTLLDIKVTKIMVGIPQRTEKDILLFYGPSMQNPATTEVVYEFVYNLPVDEARNLLIRKALEQNCDWIFFVGDDMFIPTLALINLFDATKRYNLQAISGNYYRKYEPLESVSMHKKEGTVKPCLIDDYDYKVGDLIKAYYAIGNDCSLFNMDIFRKLKEPWFKTFSKANGDLYDMTEDVFFTKRLVEELNIIPVVHTGVQCGHFDKYSGKIYGHRSIVENNEIINPYNFALKIN